MAFFCLTIIGDAEHFQCFNFVISFLKNARPFRKTGLAESFLAESNKIENATFPYKTAMSEANVEKNRMESTEWTYQKEC